MFEYRYEKELVDFLVLNFEEYFDFKFIGREIHVKSGYIDLLGEDDDTVYIIEIKKRMINLESLEQAIRYRDSFETKKQKKIVVAAPEIEKGLMEYVSDEIILMTLEGVKYKEDEVKHPIIQIRLRNKKDENLVEWANNQQNLNNSVKKLMDYFVMIFGTANIDSVESQIKMAKILASVDKVFQNEIGEYKNDSK